MDDQDSGRTAMLLCGVLLGIMRERGIVDDQYIRVLGQRIEREAASEGPAEQRDMLAAARWLRHTIGGAND